MNLVDSLPKNFEDEIILRPSGKIGDVYFNGSVSQKWFINKHESLAYAEVPLSDKRFSKLQSIGKYWKYNALRWRNEGII